MNNPKIAVIMPSYLGDYEGASKNRDMKIIRATNSFMANPYINKELVIIADGCKKTRTFYKINCKKFHSIHLVQIEKQPLFSGNVRQAGIDYAINHLKADIIAYLDIDDVIIPDHLRNIANNIKDYDWLYFDDMLYVHDGKIEFLRRNVKLVYQQIGTSNIAHRAKKEFSWAGCDEWGHDWKFIQKLITSSNKYEKADFASYIVHHIKGWFDN